MLDLEILLPVGFLFFSTFGVVYSGLAGYRYFRFERGSETLRVPFALGAMIIQYGCVTGALASREHLVPWLLFFLAAAGLIVAIWLGVQAQTDAGKRVAVAACATIAGYYCFFGGHYHHLGAWTVSG